MPNKVHRIDLKYDCLNDMLYGSIQANSLFVKLVAVINQKPGVELIEISFREMVLVDVTFARYFCISLSKYYAGLKGVFLTNVPNSDIMENLHAASVAENLPMIAWYSNTEYVQLGKPLSTALQPVLDKVLLGKADSTAAVSTALNISVQNASNHLRKLHAMRLIQRIEITAPTGGIEYIYSPIFASEGI